MTDQGNPKSWVAVLTPYRSLSRQGFIAVMAAIAAANFIAGVIFFSIGAWPVVGFCGLDVLIMYWAFRSNFIDGHRQERIEITAHDVVLQVLAARHAPREQRFVRRWLRVELEEDTERELIGRLFLRSHGQRTEIGHFLAPVERQSLARELRRALASPFY